MTRMSMTSAFLILVGVTCGVGRQLILKAGATRVGVLGTAASYHVVGNALRACLHPLVLLGFARYVVEAGVRLVVPSRAPLDPGVPVARRELCPGRFWLHG